jgi:hypothetical protein
MNPMDTATRPPEGDHRRSSYTGRKRTILLRGHYRGAFAEAIPGFQIAEAAERTVNMYCSQKSDIFEHLGPDTYRLRLNWR